jgi:hypothetical protein
MDILLSRPDEEYAAAIRKAPSIKKIASFPKSEYESDFGNMFNVGIKTIARRPVIALGIISVIQNKTHKMKMFKAFQPETVNPSGGGMLIIKIKTEINNIRRKAFQYSIRNNKASGLLSM